MSNDSYWENYIEDGKVWDENKNRMGYFIRHDHNQIQPNRIQFMNYYQPIHREFSYPCS